VCPKVSTAQGYDINNVAIPNLVYSWSLPAGGGTIGGNGVFTAGTATGTYTVQASSIQSGYATTVNGLATVAVTTTAGSAVPNISTSTFNISRLMRIFGKYLNGANFNNFLGGQFQINSGGVVETVQLVPGVVQIAFSGTSLSVMPNGQSTAQNFVLPSTSVIQPRNASLNAGDKVIIVTVSGQVSAVLKVGSATTGQYSSQYGNHQGDNGQGQQTQPGWSHGGKNGWRQGSNGDGSGRHGD